MATDIWSGSSSNANGSAMARESKTDRMFIGFVEVERTTGITEILPPESAGGFAQMVVCAETEGQFREFVTEDMANEGLRVVEIKDIAELSDINSISEDNPYLAENIQDGWAKVKTIFGNIHVFDSYEDDDED